MPQPAAASHHNAHQSTAQIHYRHHPFHGHSVVIIRWLRKHHSDSLIVELGDGLRIAVPSWMLDAGVCANLIEETRPRVSLQTLLRLRELLDAQSLRIKAAEHHAVALALKGGCDDATAPTPTGTETTATGLRKERSLGESAPEQARAMSAVSDRVVDRSDSSRRSARRRS